jgi:alpha-galactosidase
LEYVPGSGRTTPVGGPTHVWTQNFAVDNGTASIPISNQDHLGAYRLVLKPAQAGVTSGTLRSSSAAKCLDVPESSTQQGTQLAIWTCNGGTNQRWTRTASGEVSVYSGSTRMCLDAYENQTTPGTPAIIWPCTGAANQQWTFNSNGTVTSRHSGLCLDVDRAATANGTKVLLWTCNGAANQQWTFQ